MANTKVKAEQLEAAQTNITSLGTLTALQVDNVNINGNTISNTDTNGNLVITPNGTGNLNINTSTVGIMGAEGESAKLSIQADEADDNADIWSFVSNTNNTLTIESYISGSSVAHMTLTPHATVASSTVTIPGKVGIGATSLTRELTVQENGQADISIVAATNQYGQLLFGDTDADNKGIVAYNNTTDVLEIWTSGSARMAVNSSGFVGINDTAPPRRLSITGEDGAYSGQTSGNSRTQLLLENNGSNYIEFLNAESNSAAIFWSNNDGQNQGAIEYKDSHMYLQAHGQANQLVLDSQYGYIHCTGSNDVRLTLSTNGTAGDNSANWVRGNSAGCSFNALTGGKFFWEIGGTERARLHNDNGLQITMGAQTGWKFRAYAYDSDSYFGVYDDNNHSANIKIDRSDGLTVFYVMGHTGNYHFYGSDTSDRDLKENIISIPDGSLSLVKQLKPCTFNFHAEGYGKDTRTGFIAQEVAEVFTTDNHVATGTDGNKDMGVDHMGIIAHLTKAVQELSAEVEALKGG